MPVQYFAREGGAVEVVYEVDFAAGTWRVVGADDDEPNSAGKIINDATGRPTFLGVQFFELEVVETVDDEEWNLYRPETSVH